MSVHYKFKSALEYDTITFDGLHISVKDLKKSILHQKRIGKTNDFDLQVTNAQTKEVYTDDNVLIPKNTSLIIARIPVSQTQKKSWDFGSQPNASGAVVSNARPAENEAAADLSKMVGSEEDKIKAMISQSTMDYDPSNYQKVRGSNQQGEVPPNYRCFKCHMAGHWIKNCPMTAGADSTDIKRSTGIPRSFIVEKPAGGYGQPILNPEKTPSPEPAKQTNVIESKVEIPEDLQCMICKDLLTDAVMIPCCGSSFCDECIRMTLMESEDHECPDCKDKDISPVTLIPNRFLRNSVTSFKLETGYIKTRKYIPKKPALDTSLSTPTSGVMTVDLDSMDNDKSVVILDTTTDDVQDSNNTQIDTTVQDDDEAGDGKSTVISEADSTQNGKTKEPKDVPEAEKVIEKPTEKEPSDNELAVEKPLDSERPPGVEVESDGDYEDNITVTMPPPHLQGRGALRNGRHLRPFLRPPGVETPPHQKGVSNNGTPNSVQSSGGDDQRPGTPTVDEQRLPITGHGGHIHSASGPPVDRPPMQHETGTEGYTIPNMADTYPSSHQTVIPPQVPPHMLHPTGPPPTQNMHAPPDVYGVPSHHNVVPPQSTGHYPPAPGQSYSAAPPQQHLGGYIPPPQHYDTRGLPPPHYDRSRPPGAMYPGRAPIMGVPAVGPPNYGAPPPGLAGPPRPLGPVPPGGMYGPPPPAQRGMPLPGVEVADKALEAFNRMMREKDERARRREEREHLRRRGDRLGGGDDGIGRRSRTPRSRSPRSRSRSLSRSSYGGSRGGRSRSRSYTRINYSRSPRSRSRSISRPMIRKMSRSPIRRSRTPRRRSRTRSKSFTISRSRSFSRSLSPRGGEYSPPRRHHPRYRSPLLRTPPRYMHKDNGGHYRGRRDFGDGGGGGDHHYGNHRHSPPPRGDYYGDHYQPMGGDHQGPPPHHQVPSYHRGGHSRGGRGRGGYHHHHHGGHRGGGGGGGGGDYYGSGGGMTNDTGFGRYGGRDKRGSPPPPRGSHYPPPLMSLKSPGPALGGAPLSQYHQEMPSSQRYDHDIQHAGNHQPPQHYGMRPPRYVDNDLPPGLDQPPPPGFEPTPPVRYHRDEPPTDRFEPPGGGGGGYPADDYPAGTSAHRHDYQDGGGGGGSSRIRKDDAKEKYDRSRNDHDHVRSRHKITPSPENNRSRDRNPSADRYGNRKPRSGKDVEKSSTASNMSGKKDRRETERRDGDRKSKERMSEEEKLRERKAKEEKREKKRKKKEAEKKKRKEEKKREKEEKSKTKKDAKSVGGVDGKPEETTQDEDPHEESDKGQTQIGDVSMESTKSEDVPIEEEIRPKADLYGDILTDGIDSKVIESYGKLTTSDESQSKEAAMEMDATFDGLELQASELDLLNVEVSPKKVLAPLPEPSKWELEETETADTHTPKGAISMQPGSPSSISTGNSGSANKVVTNEVLKRAENAIFAKAINAIRPIEIKKISMDRAKLYSGESVAPKEEKEKTSLTPDKKSGGHFAAHASEHLSDQGKKTDAGSEKVAKVSTTVRTKITGPSNSPPSRVSVRERLGGKVDESTGSVISSSGNRRSRTRTPPRLLQEGGKKGGARDKDRDRDRDRDRERERDRDKDKDRDIRRGGNDRRLDSKVSRPDRITNESHQQRSSSSSRHQNQNRGGGRPASDSRDRNSGRQSSPPRSSYDRQSRNVSSRSGERPGNDHRRGGFHQDRRRSRSRSKSRQQRTDRNDKGNRRREDQSESSSSKINSDSLASRMNPENPSYKASSNEDHSSRRNPTVQESSSQSRKPSASSASLSEAPRRSTLMDESNFEPDYDEHLEPDPSEMRKKQQKDSVSVTGGTPVKSKLKRSLETSSSSDSDDENESSSDSSSSSDSESEEKSKRKNKKKNRKKKKKTDKKRKSASSDDDDSQQDGEKAKKRKHKRNKQLKKKKKSKHK